jgi:hypothetical protein
MSLQLHIEEAVNRLVSIARSRHLTNASNQSLIYQKKLKEAQDYKAAENPNLDDYPFIKADKEAYGDEDANTTADRIISAETAQNAQLAAIEKARHIAKASLLAAETHEETVAAMNTLRASLDLENVI